MGVPPQQRALPPRVAARVLRLLRLLRPGRARPGCGGAWRRGPGTRRDAQQPRARRALVLRAAAPAPRLDRPSGLCWPAGDSAVGGSTAYRRALLAAPLTAPRTAHCALDTVHPFLRCEASPTRAASPSMAWTVQHLTRQFIHSKLHTCLPTQSCVLLTQYGCGCGCAPTEGRTALRAYLSVAGLGGTDAPRGRPRLLNHRSRISRGEPIGEAGVARVQGNLS